MKNIELSIQEIRGLIKKYEGELRQVNYQATRIKQILLELKTSLRNHKVLIAEENNNQENHKSLDVEDTSVNTDTLVAGTINSIRLPVYGYKLSTWDQFILNSLDQAEHMLESSDFLTLAKKEDFHVSERLNEEQLKGKISRSLHKLVNKKELLVKINTPGKGYAYALNTWLDETGKLMRKYEHRT
jgi:hypothetical protein